MLVMSRSSSSPSLFVGPFSTRAGAPGKCRSLPDVHPFAGSLSIIHNRLPRAGSGLSLHSRLDDQEDLLPDLGSTDSLEAGDLRQETPSPDTLQQLAECRALLDLPRHCAVQRDAEGRLGAVADGSAEYLLAHAHGLDAAAALRTAGALRRGGFQPPGEHVSTVGDIADAMARLGERERRRALPAAVCAATASALTASMAQDGAGADPWHQFGLDLARNPYTLDGVPQASLQAFQRATQPLPPVQQRLVRELHQGMLAPLEACIFFGNVLHPDGTLLRGDDGGHPDAPRADTRFHLAIDATAPDDARAVLVVHHDRPLGAALPRTAGLDALPERRILDPDSAYRVTLRARCSANGTVSVDGEHSVRLRYPAAVAPTTAPQAQPPTTIDARVHGQLTADIMDLHAQAISGHPHAVALYLARPAGNQPPPIVGLLALARQLDAQTGRQSLLPPELARFAFAELRRCAESARGQDDRDLLALLRRALFRAGERVADLAQGMPAHGHWQHARQELCALLETVFYRSAEASRVPALVVPATRSERQERDRQLGQLIQVARAARWAELDALLPVERFGMWRTTRVQRPAACAFQHGESGRYLEVALACLNTLGQRVAPITLPVRTDHSAASPR